MTPQAPLDVARLFGANPFATRLTNDAGSAHVEVAARLAPEEVEALLDRVDALSLLFDDRTEAFFTPDGHIDFPVDHGELCTIEGYSGSIKSAYGTIDLAIAVLATDDPTAQWVVISPSVERGALLLPLAA